MTGQAASGSPKRVKFDAEFRRIQGITESILGQALSSTRSQQEFQSSLFALLQPEFDRIIEEGEFADQLGTDEARTKFLRDTIERNTKIGEQAAALTDRLVNSVNDLGTLTETDRQLISSAIGNARAEGDKAITDFVATNFRAGNEIAAARGLRPTDSPIGNIRGRVAEEATAQKGSLERTLAGRASELALTLPMQRTALIGQIAGQTGGLAAGGAEFQAALAQNAAANRINLAGTAGQLGLGLAGQTNLAPGALTASRPAFGQESSSAGGGISTRNLKTNERQVDSAEMLRRLQTLPIKAWQYLWEAGEEAFHVGPYAEDFQEAFGGESYQINLLHALGVSMVALQELAGRLDRLENRLMVGMLAESKSQEAIEA